LHSISLFLSPQLLVDIFHTHRFFPHIRPLQLYPKCIAVKWPSFHLYICLWRMGPGGQLFVQVILQACAATYHWGHPCLWSSLLVTSPRFVTAPLCPCPLYRVFENINSNSKSHICCSQLRLHPVATWFIEF
jgi:hypothetical protein